MAMQTKLVKLERKIRFYDADTVVMWVWAIIHNGEIVGYSFNPEGLLS